LRHERLRVQARQGAAIKNLELIRSPAPFLVLHRVENARFALLVSPVVDNGNF